MKQRHFISTVFKFIKNNKVTLILSSLFILHLFFMFYQLEYRLSFGWDQVDNAWAAKRILIEGHYPLLGMVAKQNSGFNIGPLYYYFVAAVYFLTNSDPIASGLLAGIASIISFWGLYYVVKKIFTENVALVSLFIYTISSYIILSERIQWPVDFVPIISLFMFYYLYKVLTQDAKYLIPLGIVLGLSFQVHFTSIFYPIIILLCIPFYPWSVRFIKYASASCAIFIAFLIPNIIAEIGSKNSQSQNLTDYLKTYYIGFHLRRVMQLVDDAFLEIGLIIKISFLQFVKFLVVPGFILAYLYKKVKKERIIFCYLIALWFIVPWFVFSTYSGEITNYYFYLQRYIILFMLAYLTVWFFQKHIIVKAVVVLFWIYFTVVNIQSYITYGKGSYVDALQRAEQSIQSGHVIQFQEGVPESYIYDRYVRLHKKK